MLSSNNSIILKQTGDQSNANAIIAGLVGEQFTVFSKRRGSVRDPSAYSNCICTTLVSWMEFEVEDNGVPFKLEVRAKRNDNDRHNLSARKCSLRTELTLDDGTTEEWDYSIGYDDHAAIGRFYEKVEIPEPPSRLATIAKRVSDSIKKLFGN